MRLGGSVLMYMTDETNKSRRSIKVKNKAVNGVIAQLGERLPCTQEVSGSIPLVSIATD